MLPGLQISSTGNVRTQEADYGMPFVATFTRRERLRGATHALWIKERLLMSQEVLLMNRHVQD